eukprot:14393684-Ditylum_brightwellii.AAC.1
MNRRTKGAVQNLIAISLVFMITVMKINCNEKHYKLAPANQHYKYECQVETYPSVPCQQDSPSNLKLHKN